MDKLQENNPSLRWPDSCHDPVVKGGIVKVVGHRLRINSSKDEYFNESLEDTARPFKFRNIVIRMPKKNLSNSKILTH